MAVGQVDRDRNVLAGREVRYGRAVVGHQGERHHVDGLIEALGHAPAAPEIGGIEVATFVEAGFGGDQPTGEQPVDLVPGRGDFRGDRGTEDRADRGEQMVTDERVLLGPDAQRHVLARDPLGDPVERRGVVAVLGEQMLGETGDGRRQRELLTAVGLIALVEQVEQFRMRGEHRRVELTGDFHGVRAHDGQGGANHRVGCWGRQGILLLRGVGPGLAKAPMRTRPVSFPILPGSGFGT